MAEDVSLLDRARALNQRPGPRCRFAALVSHPQAQEIQQLLDACPTEIQYTTAAQVLKEIGVEISNDTISRHVRGLCSCRS